MILAARYPKTLGRQGVTVNFVLKVPASVKVDLATVNGAIHLTGVQAAVKAETTNGSIEGTGLGGAIVAGTTNGSIKLSLAGLGENGIQAETTNGSIELKLPEALKATISARCVNGGISVSREGFPGQNFQGWFLSGLLGVGLRVPFSQKVSLSISTGVEATPGQHEIKSLSDDTLIYGSPYMAWWASVGLVLF